MPSRPTQQRSPDTEPPTVVSSGEPPHDQARTLACLAGADANKAAGAVQPSRGAAAVRHASLRLRGVQAGSGA